MKFRAFVLFGFRTDYDYWYFAVNFNDISVMSYFLFGVNYQSDSSHICSAENIL